MLAPADRSSPWGSGNNNSTVEGKPWFPHPTQHCTTSNLTALDARLKDHAQVDKGRIDTQTSVEVVSQATDSESKCETTTLSNVDTSCIGSYLPAKRCCVFQERCLFQHVDCTNGHHPFKVCCAVPIVFC